jgi:hypothetical protein
MNRITLPSRADIFIKHETKKIAPPFQAPKKHPVRSFLKGVGIGTSIVVLFLGINISAYTFDTKTDRQVVDPTSSTPHRRLDSYLPQVSFPGFNQANVTTTAQTAPPATGNVNSFATAPTFTTPTFTTPTFTNPNFNTPNFATPVANTPSFNTPTFNTTPVAAPIQQAAPNLSGAATQINAMQNQIVQQMQACIQMTQQAQAQVAAYKQQIAQIDAAQAATQNQIFSVNANDPNAQNITFQLQSQRDQLTFQRSQTANALSQVSNQATNAKSSCQTAVSVMETQKRNVENQLHDSFNQALNVPLN